MKFADYVVKDAVIARLKATDAHGAIREMVQSLVNAGSIKEDDYEKVTRYLIKREELGSTGLGRGIATPYTNFPGVERNIVCVAVSAEGIDFDTPDGEKVHLFIMVISPKDQEGFLRVIEHLTRQLKDETLCRFLKHAKTKDEILSLLDEADDNMFGT